MASWILVPCLVRLFDEFNAVAPSRDKASDGRIGDAAHAQTNSDHNPDETSDALRDHDVDSKNEVHAIDVDVDLRTPGLTMEMVVQHLLGRCRSGAERRLKYIIYNRRIWSASSGWKQQKYTGSNPHDHHAHFSASYVTANEASTASWHLEDIPVALTSDDKKFITNEITRIVKAQVTVTSLDVPTSTENGNAALTAFRQSTTTGISDTGVGKIAKAVKEALVAETPPSNVKNL